jgi:hypothetical protein
MPVPAKTFELLALLVLGDVAQQVNDDVVGWNKDRSMTTRHKCCDISATAKIHQVRRSKFYRLSLLIAEPRDLSASRADIDKGTRKSMPSTLRPCLTRTASASTLRSKK